MRRLAMGLAAMAVGVSTHAYPAFAQSPPGPAPQPADSPATQKPAPKPTPAPTTPPSTTGPAASPMTLTPNYTPPDQTPRAIHLSPEEMPAVPTPVPAGTRPAFPTGMTRLGPETEPLPFGPQPEKPGYGPSSGRIDTSQHTPMPGQKPPPSPRPPTPAVAQDTTPPPPPMSTIPPPPSKESLGDLPPLDSGLPSAHVGAETDSIVVFPDEILTRNEYVAAGCDGSGYLRMFTTGGDPAVPTDNQRLLLFNYTEGHGAQTSFATIQVDKEAGILQHIPPRDAPYQDGARVITTWSFGPIDVVQEVRLAKSYSTSRADVVRFGYKLVNRDTKAHKMGLRLLLDTRVGHRDDAPVYFAGTRYEPYERRFSDKEIPAYWQAFEGTLKEPGLLARGTLSGGDASPPDLVILAGWSNLKDALWNYAIKRTRRIYDTAVALFWLPVDVAPGSSREIVTYYGLGKGASQGDQLIVNVSAPTELSVKNGQLSPNPIPVSVVLQNLKLTAIPSPRVKLTASGGLHIENPEGNDIKLEDLAPNATTQTAFSLYATVPETTSVFTLKVEVSSGDPSIPTQVLDVAVRVPSAQVRLAGTLRDSTSGKPLADATVKVQPVDASSETRTVRTDAQGAWSVEVPSGRQYLVTPSDSMHLFESVLIDPAASADTLARIDLKLPAIEVGRAVVLDNIYFDFAKAELKPESDPELQRVLEFMQSHPNAKVEIGGHADNVGTPYVNQKLSEARAEAVKTWLVLHDVRPQAVTTRGFGATRPRVPNSDESSRALNRRTEFTIMAK